MANSISQAFTKEKTDELYTPPILVKPIIKFLQLFYIEHMEFEELKYRYTDINCLKTRKPIVLCPFDMANSEFVIEISKLKNFDLKYGHIETGQDFFNYNYGKYDVVISNPPFSKKKIIYEKLLKENKPFALLGNAMQINYEEIGRLFSEYEMQILSFDRRVSYNGQPSSFMSCYFCHNFLPNDLVFEKLENNNVGKNFVASRMYENAA